MCWVFLRLLTSVESKGNTGLRSCSGPRFKKKMHYWKTNLLITKCFGWCAVLDLTWIVLTTPLAMTESFPATERTPSLSWDMSGAFGSMLVNRYELPTCVRQTRRETAPSSDSFLGTWGLSNRIGPVVDVDVLRFKPCLTCLFLWIVKKVCWTYRSTTRHSFQSWSGFILDNRRKLCIG